MSVLAHYWRYIAPTGVYADLAILVSRGADLAYLTTDGSTDGAYLKAA